MAGIDEVLIALFSSIAASAASGSPDAPNAGAGLPRGAGAGGGFDLPVPETKGLAETVGSPGPAINLDAGAAVTEQLAQVLAAQGPPPVVPLEPSPAVAKAGTPAPTAPPAPTLPAKPPPSIGEILISSPEAIAAVANLLGIGQRPNPDRPAPIPGGTVGNVVPGFGLPSPPGIGQLLAQIPRLV